MFQFDLAPPSPFEMKLFSCLFPPLIFFSLYPYTSIMCLLQIMPLVGRDTSLGRKFIYSWYEKKGGSRF